MTKFLEQVHVVHGAREAVIPASEDIWAGNTANVMCDVVNMENAASAVWIITLTGGTGTASIQILAADDATPTTTSAVSFMYKAITGPDTQGVTTETKTMLAGHATLSDMIYVLEVDAAKLAELGYGYVQLQALEHLDRPVDGHITGPILMGLRSAEDVTPTQVV